MLIETVANIFGAAKQFILFGIYLSFNVGKFLVGTGSTVLKVVFALVQNFWTTAAILHEEFLYFLNDFHNEIITVSTTVISAVTYVFIYVSRVASNVYLVITSLIQICVDLLNTVSKLIVIPKFIITNFYKLFNQIGAGVWFLLTLIPKSIQNGFELFYECGYAILRSLSNFTSKILSCITEISFESIFGLCVAILLISFAWKTRLTYPKIVFHKLSQTRKYIRRSKVCNKCTDEPTPVDVKKLKAQVHRLEEEKLCVVCQERNRSVLILPCRHFCMCDECAIRIVYSDGMCPICRTGIQKFIENIFT